MRHPKRDLPRAVHSSMTIVLILFVLANCAYFIVLDPQIVASSNTVALDFGAVTIGKLGAVVFSSLVAISCFGALSNGFFTSRFTFLCFLLVPLCRQCVEPHTCTPCPSMTSQDTLERSLTLQLLG
jgi:amino acid transporter